MSRKTFTAEQIIFELREVEVRPRGEHSRFAHGLGQKVIWTARKGTKLHFDVRQYNCLFWDENELDKFKDALSNWIEAIFGHGPN
jgi:hypothetical protein